MNEVNGIDIAEVRRQRKAARCTLYEAAIVLGCSPAMYSKYETEHEPFPPLLVQKLLNHIKEIERNG